MTKSIAIAHAVGLMWFRRDLRLEDNRALIHALSKCKTLFAVFVLDTDILSSLPKKDRRVEFILNCLHELNASIQESGQNKECGLLVLHERAEDAIPKLAQKLGATAVFANHDDEPQALSRDASVRGQLANIGISFETHKDHVIFERQEVLTQSAKPYGVFTPYKNAWLKKVTSHDLNPTHAPALAQWGKRPKGFENTLPPGLEAIGFESTNLSALGIPMGEHGAQQLFNDFKSRMTHYKDRRDFPFAKGPSYLSVHLRFGTISVRTLAKHAHEAMTKGDVGAGVWLSELIWRDFYHQIMFHHPRVVQHAFKPEYDLIVWESGASAQKFFTAWCQGETGYPLVDAAMMQLNQTGYMHNRLRMVTACFLVKDLGIDWRWGEAYFAQHLNDFDLAANNGGWQWASSSGCDAQPYFRIFNPITQSEKFDPEGKFIKRYLPQFSAWPAQAIHAPWLASDAKESFKGVQIGKDYPPPIIDHAKARELTLKRYSVVKKAI
jgi:deoxyribodipyrimidine photo-lyase